MTYVWLDWLADVLADAGCVVAEYSGWAARGRPASSGPFNPAGVLHHHTGTTASYTNPAPTLNMCVNGRPDLPGPLAHAVIGYDGTVHVIAAGRANHAGQCNGFGPFSTGDGNAQLIGWEIDYNGTQDISPEQLDAAARASAAVLAHWGRDESHAAIHAETSTTGKWDTGGVSGDRWRALIRDELAGPPAPIPPGRTLMWVAKASDGRWFSGDAVSKTYINSPDTLDFLIAAGATNMGTVSSTILNEFPTRESEWETLMAKLDV